jgi:hypothetical protein
MPLRMTHFHCRTMAGLATCSLVAASCAMGSAQPAATSQSASPAQGAPEKVPALEKSDVRSIEATRAALDKQFIMGPSRLDAFKLRSRWQTSVSMPSGVTLTRLFTPRGDSVFTLDSGNGISRLKSDSGERIWRDVVGAPKDTVLGVERGESRGTDVVLVTNDVDVITLECGNGIRMGTQHLERYPSTGSVRVGSYLIYGTRVGQVAWQQYAVGHAWKSNALGGAIRAEPIMTPAGIAAGSTDGVVALLDPASASSLWRFRAGGAVEGSLATDGMRIFCTARDNYVYALDINRGRTAWKLRADGPLGPDAACVGDAVYVHESGGLVALAADGEGKLDGAVRWRSAIKGLPIVATGSGVIAWDRASSTCTLFDPASGAVRASAVLEGVVDVRATHGTETTIHFVASDGRVQQTQPLEGAAGAARTASATP